MERQDSDDRGRKETAAPEAPIICPACESANMRGTVHVPDHEYGVDYVATFEGCRDCQTEFQRPMPRCGSLGRLIFGSYGFAEHATHHWEPAIPYDHLQKATDELAARDAQFAARRGYWVTLTAQVLQLSSPPQRIAPRHPAHSRPT